MMSGMVCAAGSGYTCNEGYAAVGDFILDCDNTTTYSASAAGCEALTCTLQDPPAHSRLNAPATLRTGDSAVELLLPDPGYNCSRLSPVTCGAGGVVQQVGVVCRGITCPEGVLPPPGSTVTGLGPVVSGETVLHRIIPVEGHHCEGLPIAVCLSGRSVAEVHGTQCVVNVCASLVPPVGSVLSSRNTTYGANVSLTAAPGYTCSGRGTVVCEDHKGVGMVQGVVCSPRTCGGVVRVPHTLPYNATVVYTGDELPLEPEEGWRCTGRAVATCHETGALTVTGLTCYELRCSFPQHLAGYTESGCAEGYHGTPVASCLEDNGVYRLTGCVENKCSPPAFPGYEIEGGWKGCTSVSACGQVACINGAAQQGTPRIACLTHGGNFTPVGCLVPRCRPSLTPGYIFDGGPTCSSQWDCGSVSCAPGYTPYDPGPRVVCTAEGWPLTVSGCRRTAPLPPPLPTVPTPIPTPAPPAPPPSRPWTRARLRLDPKRVPQRAERPSWALKASGKLRASSTR
eukprot:Sspe_Gene.65349::Locus_38691_Transcript_1_1_Confidence_1.000_Length_1748::g.65349::m.65349